MCDWTPRENYERNGIDEVIAGYVPNSEAEDVINEHIQKIEQEKVQLQTESEAYRAFVRDIAEDWDCDVDAHKYGTSCRACDAKKLLNTFTKEGNDHE